MGNYFCGNASAGGWVGFNDPRGNPGDPSYNGSQGLSAQLPYGFDYDPNNDRQAGPFLKSLKHPKGGIMHVWRDQGWFVNMFEIESNDAANNKVRLYGLGAQREQRLASNPNLFTRTRNAPHTVLTHATTTPQRRREQQGRVCNVGRRPRLRSPGRRVAGRPWLANRCKRDSQRFGEVFAGREVDDRERVGGRSKYP